MEKILKKTLKISGIALITFFGLVLIYLGLAFCLSRIAVNKDVVAKDEVTIFILSNGVHTDIVVPVKTDLMDWSRLVKFEHTAGKDTSANYVAFGWGDKGFYLETPTWADLTARVAFKAAFALGKSAIHATFYKQLEEGINCRRITIGHTAYKQLVEYISSSFQKNKNGELLHITTNANYGNHDAFYEGTGSYSMLHTCNTWANNGLKACGLKASLWTPFDTGIFYHYTKK